MLTEEQKAALINTCFEAEAENFNRFFMFGFIKETDFFNEANKKNREVILKFLAETNFLTQRFFMELIFLREEYEEICA
jgi:hypothetical protein